jgi:hypothetical protein
MADAQDLKSCARLGRAGSSPAPAIDTSRMWFFAGFSALLSLSCATIPLPSATYLLLFSDPEFTHSPTTPLKA